MADQDDGALLPLKDAVERFRAEPGPIRMRMTGGASTRNLPAASAVGAGFEHSLTALSDGTVRAFGYNNQGQIGNGTTTDATTPATVSGLSGVTG